MAIRSIAQLKAWFKRGAYPTAEQFADWLDSFFHKEEKVPVDSVDGLSGRLNAKYAQTDGKELERRHNELAKEFEQHKGANETDFENVRKSIGELEQADEDILADLETVHTDIENLQETDRQVHTELDQMHDTDNDLRRDLKSAQGDIGTIRDMLKGGGTLAEAKAALVALGTNYNDVYAIANTLKTFLHSKDTAETTINTWTEIESFLRGITDTQSLTALLSALETKITGAYNAAISEATEDIHGNVMFATFGVDWVTGELYARTLSEYTGAGFEIDKNGNFNVVI